MQARMGVGVAMLVALMAFAANAQGVRPIERDNPGAQFGMDDYPAEAMRNREEGRVVAKLRIGPDGLVTACAVDVSSGSKSLDEATCRIALSRVRFSPARDDRGRAIASSYTLSIRWVLSRPTAHKVK